MTTGAAGNHGRRPAKHAVLDVLEPGPFSTIQDFGRPGYEYLGVPHAGACDRWGLAVANSLLGNSVSAAGLEMTLAGPTLRARRACTIGLGGADLGAEVLGTGARITPGTTHSLRKDDVLRFRGSTRGLRAYLSLPGGIDVQQVLGSRSTYVPARIGGIDGRPIEAGDTLSSVSSMHEEAGIRVWPDRTSLEPDRDAVLRVLPGPDAADLPSALVQLLCSRWVIDSVSDRTGVRLVADTGDYVPPQIELISRPVTWGAIQVPPSGAPIILQADHQTVGGYPVVAVVITADLPVLAQLRPGGSTGFALIDLPDAVAALRDQTDTFRRAVERSLQDVLWQDLWLNTSG